MFRQMKSLSWTHFEQPILEYYLETWNTAEVQNKLIILTQLVSTIFYLCFIYVGPAHVGSSGTPWDQGHWWWWQQPGGSAAAMSIMGAATTEAEQQLQPFLRSCTGRAWTSGWAQRPGLGPGPGSLCRPRSGPTCPGHDECQWQEKVGSRARAMAVLQLLPAASTHASPPLPTPAPLLPHPI